MCKSQNSHNSLFYDHFDKYFVKVVLRYMFSSHRSTVHKSIISKFLAVAPALPFSKSVCKSQNGKCVCRSQNFCLNFCVNPKIENVCVSHKIVIHEILPRETDRGGWQWSDIALIGA